MADFPVAADRPDACQVRRLFLGQPTRSPTSRDGVDNLRRFKRFYYESHNQLRMLRSSEIDLAILDIMMPGESGIEACQRLRRGGGPPLVFLSALGEESDGIAGLEMGASHSLPKPCSARDIVATLDTARCDHSRHPPVIERVVAARLALTVGAAQTLVASLNDFLETQGLSPSQALAAAATCQ